LERESLCDPCKEEAGSTGETSMFVSIEIDDWVNVVAGFLSIVAIVTGWGGYWLDRQNKKRDQWILSFVRSEKLGAKRKVALIKECRKIYKEPKVRAIFIEAAEQNGYSPEAALKHYDYLATAIATNNRVD
jgi:hypothetical protein